MPGKVAIITGGTGALGKAVTQTMIDAGYHAVVTYREDTELRDLLDSLGEQKSQLDAYRVDVTKESSLDDLALHVQQKHGQANALICLVGGFTPGTFGDEIGQQFDKMMPLNAKSFLLTANAILPLLQHSVKQGKGKTHAKIIAIAAKPALEPAKNLGVYAASKAAVVSLVKTMATELLSENILVNAIAPSTIDTLANRKAMPKTDPKNWVKPEAIAQSILYLVEQDSVSGTVLPVYGHA